MKLDQHFTDADAARKLVESLIERLDPACARRYIEPSCGNGAFVEALQAAGVPRQRIRSMEIDKKLPADVHGDFLKATHEALGIIRWKPNTTVVVGNPPFGRNGRLARAFLNKAAQFANWVCLVLPRSMHGANGCGLVNPRLELVYERQLDGAFATTKAKCNWQEWFLMPEGHTGRRPTETTPDPDGLYNIVTLDDNYHLVIQRCGGSAGKVTHCNGTGEGKYYIRSRYPEVLQAFRNLGKHEVADLTTHQRSLSARLLHELLERQLLHQYVSQIKGAI